MRRLTSTKSAEYSPVWSPDGTRLAFAGTTRDLTSSETTMEDTHVWVMNADGTGRVEIGAGIDNRQGDAALVGRRPPRLLHACRTAVRCGWLRLPAGGGAAGAGREAIAAASARGAWAAAPWPTRSRGPTGRPTSTR